MNNSWWELAKLVRNKIVFFYIMNKLLLPPPVVASFVEDSMCPVLPTIWLRLSEQTWFSRVCTKGKEGKRKSWEGENCWTCARRRRVSRPTRSQLWICWDMLAMTQTLVVVFFAIDRTIKQESFCSFWCWLSADSSVKCHSKSKSNVLGVVVVFVLSHSHLKVGWSEKEWDRIWKRKKGIYWYK